jgi:hypothetical protein
MGSETKEPQQFSAGAFRTWRYGGCAPRAFAGRYPTVPAAIGGELKGVGGSMPGGSLRMSGIAESTTAGRALSVETMSAQAREAAVGRSALFSQP